MSPLRQYGTPEPPAVVEARRVLYEYDRGQFDVRMQRAIERQQAWRDSHVGQSYSVDIETGEGDRVGVAFVSILRDVTYPSWQDDPEAGVKTWDNGVTTTGPLPLAEQTWRGEPPEPLAEHHLLGVPGPGHWGGMG